MHDWQWLCWNDRKTRHGFSNELHDASPLFFLCMNTDSSEKRVNSTKTMAKEGQTRASTRALVFYVKSARGKSVFEVCIICLSIQSLHSSKACFLANISDILFMTIGAELLELFPSLLRNGMFYSHVKKKRRKIRFLHIKRPYLVAMLSMPPVRYI